VSSRSCAVPLLQVFYPGGYNPNPVGWRGRSLMAIGGICLTMVPIFVWSAKNESRPLPPTHWIPSQLWYDYFGNKAIGEPYTPKKWKVNE